MHLSYILKVKSFYIRFIYIFIKKLSFILRRKLKQKIIFFKIIFLPSKKKIYTVLKSTHVNKKSKEQFQSKKYQAILHIIFKNNKITKILHLKILKFLNLGKKNLFLPLQIKVLEKVII